MHFLDKLAKLTEESSAKSRVARAAGLPASAISNYITRRQMPRGDKALLIARALEVPLEWILDPSTEWPPPSRKGVSLNDFSDDAIVKEAGRRAWMMGKAWLEQLAAAEIVDWKALKLKLSRVGRDEKIPENLRPELAIARGVVAAYMRWRSYSTLLQSPLEMPGLPSHAELSEAPARYQKLGANSDFMGVHGLLGKRPNQIGLAEGRDSTTWKDMLELHAGDEF